MLSQAEEARTATEKAGAKESVQLEVAGSYGTDGKIDKAKLEENLQNLNGTVTEKEGYLYEVTVDGETFDILETGEIKEANIPQEPPFENTIKPGEIVTEEQGNTEYRNNGTAVIPVGFAIVPNLDDVSQGLVISDVENDINDTGNQFVWIPVENAEDYTTNTTYENTTVSGSTEYDFGYLPLSDTEIGIKDEMDDKQKGNLTFAKEKELVIDNMVNKYKAGGFYISRYEAGKESEDTVVSKKGVDVWINIPQKETKEKSKTFKNDSNVKSALASGVQWDMVLEFIKKETRLDSLNQPYNVTTEVESRHTKSKAMSGQNPSDKVCNIYDLEGNFYEYVAEKNTCNTNFPCNCRGGYYTSGSASYRSCGGDADVRVSFRFVLYIM